MSYIFLGNVQLFLGRCPTIFESMSNFFLGRCPTFLENVQLFLGQCPTFFGSMSNFFGKCPIFFCVHCTGCVLIIAVFKFKNQQKKLKLPPTNFVETKACTLILI